MAELRNIAKSTGNSQEGPGTGLNQFRKVKNQLNLIVTFFHCLSMADA
jgi:hypothetical protein